MHTEHLVSVRNLIALGIVVSAAFFRPEISFAVARPLFSLWRRIKLIQTSLSARLQSSRRERFWEIDMTKLEP